MTNEKVLELSPNPMGRCRGLDADCAISGSGEAPRGRPSAGPWGTRQLASTSNACLATLVVGALAAVAHGWVGKTPTIRELAERAPVIVKGEVTAVSLVAEVDTRYKSRSGAPLKGYLFTATCRTIHVLKGQLPGEGFELQFELGSVSPPSVIVRKGKTYLLFLEKAGEKYTFVDEHRSALLADPGLPREPPRGESSADKVRVELEAWLRSDLKEVVLEALESLPSLGSQEDLGPRFAQFKNSKDEELRGAAAVALLEVGDPSAVGAAIDILAGGLETEKGVARQQRRVLSQLSNMRDPNALTQLVQLLEHRSVPIRRSVASALRRSRRRALVPHLVRGLQNDDMQTRYDCLMGLAELVKSKRRWGPSMRLFESKQEQYVSRWLKWWDAEGKQTDWEHDPATTQSRPKAKKD